MNRLFTLPFRIHGRNHFVADGQWRAAAANEPLVRAEVQAEFAESMKSAGWLRRIMLRRQINREVRRRLEALAPSQGLY